MLLRAFWIFIFAIFVAQGVTQASPAALTYQGRIIKTDGTPLEYANVSFVFQITDPTGACVVYQEQYSGYNMVNSGGVFDVPIGTGTVQYPTTGSFTILDAFNNTKTFTCGTCSSSGSSYTCSNASGNYTAALGDNRRLRVQFYDGSGWKVISPDSIVRSVPYAGFALSAQKLGNNTAADFITKDSVNNSGAGSVSCDSGSFLTWDATTQKFGCAGVSGSSGGTVTNVTSANSYLSVANGSSTPALTLNVGTTANTVAAGNDPRIINALQTGSSASGDLSGSYPGPTVMALQGVGVSATAPTNGQFFKFNGTNWLAATIGISDVNGLSASLSGALTQSAFNGYVASASCTSSQSMYWNSVSGNFQCQSINVGLAGDVTGSIGAAKVVALQNNPVDTTAPTSNQILQWNGFKWAPATLPAGNVGTVTSVSGTAPISVATGTSTPVISISQANTTTNGYLSSADWNTFNSKQAAGNYLTTLTGDVTAAGPGSATASVVKLQGSTLTLTTPISGDYLRFNGTAFVNSPLQISDLSGTIPGSLLPAFTGDVTSSAGSTTLTLAAAGTAGTYYKVTTDAKGRVISGANALVAVDIPALDWSKITTGKPTTLAGYGITDSLINNAGGTPSIQTGLDASKPASPSAGAIYFATDTNKIYQYNSGAWAVIASASGSGGTINGVTAGTGLSGGGASGSVTLNLANTAVTAGSYTRANIAVDAQGRITSATNGAAIDLTSEVTGALPIANGGTGATTATSAFNGLSPLTTKGDIVVRDSTNNIRLGVGTDGQVLTADSAQASGVKWTTPAATGVTNVSGTSPISVANGATTPTVSIASGSATGQTLRWNSTNWVTTKLLYTDLVNATAASPWPASSCTAGQAITWSSASDSFACTTIAVSDANITYGSQAAKSFLASPTGAAGAPTFRNITSTDLPTTGATGVFVNGGNSFGAATSIGTNDARDLVIKTNNTTRMTILSNGSVGFGSTALSWVDMSLYKADATAEFSIVSDSSTNSAKYPAMNVIAYGGSPAVGSLGNPAINLINMRGNSSTSAVIKNTEILGTLTFNGATQTNGNYKAGASITALAMQDFSSTTVGTDLLFQTTALNSGSNPAERMRLTNGGYLGVGTQSPLGYLHVSPPGQTSITNSAVASGEDMYFLGAVTSGTGKSWSGLHLQAPTGSNLILWGSGATATTPGAVKFAISGRSSTDENAATVSEIIGYNTQGASTSGGGLTFLTRPNSGSLTEKMRIDENGNVGIGQPAPANTLTVNGAVSIGLNANSINGKPSALLVSSSNAGGYAASFNVTTTASVNQITFNNPNGEIGAINSGGTTTSYLTNSDRRLKGDIRDLDADKIDDIFTKLRPRQWEWKYAEGKPHGEGFIAQELHELIPEAVTTGDANPVGKPGDKDFTIWRVDYSKLTPYLTKQVQNLMQKISSLFERVQKLEESTKQNQVTRDIAMAHLQAENENLKSENHKQDEQIKALKSYLCAKDPKAPICK